jgi:hypothetical protein
MGQVAARIQVEAHEAVARLQQREEDRLVHLAAAVGLHVGKLRSRTASWRVRWRGFDLVDIFAAAIIALAGIAFGIFVGQDRALSPPAQRGW